MGFTPTAAIANAHAWFECNSGWAPPDDDTLAEWVDDGVCRCPDDCLVTPGGWCEHGLASWWLILSAETAETAEMAKGPAGAAAPTETAEEAAQPRAQAGRSPASSARRATHSASISWGMRR